MFPQAIEEFRTFGQLSGEKRDVEFASAMGEGFRSAGWNGALTRAIEMRKAQRKTGYSSAYEIATLYSDLGQKVFKGYIDESYNKKLLGIQMVLRS